MLGVGGGIIVTGANSLASSVSEAHRATTLNLVNLFFGLGGLATPFISANFLRHNSARLCNLMAAITLVTLGIHLATPMPTPAGGESFVIAQAFTILGKPILFLLALFLFLYVSCEVGVWNWLTQHLLAKGIPEKWALNILSLGFALGLLVGRAVASRVLVSVPGVTVLLAASIAMAVTTYFMLQAMRPIVAGTLVFLAGVSMAPVFPTALAVVGDIFPKMASTALGTVIASGWLGLAVSSRVIGAIAGSDSRRLSRALLVIPACAVLMLIVAISVQHLVH